MVSSEIFSGWVLGQKRLGLDLLFIFILVQLSCERKMTLYSYGNPDSPTPRCKREFNICAPTSLMGCQQSLEERCYVVITVKQRLSPPLEAREVLQKNAGGKRGKQCQKFPFFGWSRVMLPRFSERKMPMIHIFVWFEPVII